MSAKYNRQCNAVALTTLGFSHALRMLGKLLPRLYCTLPQKTAQMLVIRPLQVVRDVSSPVKDGHKSTDSQSFIYCIGDSHVSFFSGTDEMQPLWPEESVQFIELFKSFRLGPVTAYNLCRNKTSSRGREKLFSLLLNHIPPYSRVLLCFGEIDCRIHLPRQLQNSQRSIEDIVEECVNRYFSVVLEVKMLGYEVLLWNVIPTTPIEYVDTHEYTAIGTCRLRNRISRVFNEKLQIQAQAEGIQFISIFDQLIHKDGLTDCSYYMDEIHLSQRAMPLALEKFTPLSPAD